MQLSKTLENYKLIKYTSLVILGSIILTISAKIKIPFYPVPMTMQTFVVVMLGITLGSKLGMIAVITYLLEGLFGLPVFSNSPEKGVGLLYFTGPTMGYLIGFIFASYISGKINNKDHFLQITLKIIISVVVIYCLGILWLGNLIGWDKPIFSLGVQPFLFAEIFKVSIIIILTKFLIKFRSLI